MKDKNTLLERDVQRLNEREVLEINIKKIETQLIVAAYQSDLQKYLEMKPTLDIHKTRYQELNETQEPIMDEKKALDRKVEKFNLQSQTSKTKYDAKCKLLTETAEKMEEDQNASTALSRRIKASIKAKSEHAEKVTVYLHFIKDGS